jgi:hypothetical protein
MAYGRRDRGAYGLRMKLANLLRAGIPTAFAALLVGAAPPNSVPRFTHWIDGITSTEPKTQVQRIDDDSFVIRQSVRTNFEAPFLYLLFGTDRALLIDSGAGGLKNPPNGGPGDRRLACAPRRSAGPADRRAFALAWRSP